jgi:c-di-GMP-binding flagellar brake protein YcgR
LPNVTDLPLRHLMPAALVLNRDGARASYPTLVLDYEAAREIAVSVPSEDDAEVHLARGDELGVEVAFGDALHRFRTTVLRRRDVPAPCLFLAWPEGVERVQRRAHPRIAVELPARIRFGAAGSRAAEPSELAGTTLDLSIGGARVALPTRLGAGTTVALRVEVPDDEVGTIDCAARVAHAGELLAPRAGHRYQAGLEFLDLPPEPRRALERYLIDVRREQLHSGIV